jgi:four helix bundle protein
MEDYKHIRLERLKQFAVNLCRTIKTRRADFVELALYRQLVRSGTAPALIYSEAISAESMDDLIHKMSIVLKELRETETNLEIISRVVDDPAIIDKFDILRAESIQLIAIFSRSISTCKAKKVK